MQKERSACSVYELVLPSGAPGPQWVPSSVSYPPFDLARTHRLYRQGYPHNKEPFRELYGYPPHRSLLRSGL